MQELNERDFLTHLDSGSITPYGLYNLDIDYPQYYSVNNYINNPHDNLDVDQKINILFHDIEVYTKNAKEFPDPTSAAYPINAITIYSTFEKIYRSYILLYQENILKFKQDNLEEYYKKILRENKYITEEDDIKIEMFGNELDLLRSVWQQIHIIDPTVISGWNCDHFDIPYIYFRLNNLLEKNDLEVHKIMSKFGSVKVNKFGGSTIIKIADYPVADGMYLYKPRDESGLNLGSKQPSYSLDWVSEDEINLKKLEYKNEGLTLDQFYMEDPINFLLYNISDVALCVNLNNKLRHIENYNLYRRLMKTSFDTSLRGSSILFDTFVLYELQKNNKYVRFGINDETNFEILPADINELPKPTGKKNIKWNITSLESKIIKNVSNTYPGAYVKNSPGKLYTEEDGLLISLDAASLYPAMIKQSNISFDSFFGRIIDPNVYKMINTLSNHLGNINLLKQFCTNILEMSINYVEKKQPANKNDAYQQNYYITSFVFAKILKNCKNFKDLFEPKQYSDYIMLRNYFLVLVDMMERLHPNAEEYNSFCYDRFINGGQKFPNTELFIIENYNETSLKIVKINSNTFDDYLKNNNLCVTLSGALFYKHEYKLGLFSDWLSLMGDRRKEYKGTRDTQKYGSFEYRFYDMLQNATKIAMNTSYGLYGLTTFRYSNSHLAKAITTEGRLMLKICQMMSELVINNESK